MIGANSSLNRWMKISVPTEITGECLVKGIGRMRSTHGRMMFESVSTNVMQKPLQIVNAHDGPAPKCIQRIIHKRTISHVSADYATTIVCRDPRVTEWSGRSPTGHCTV